MRLAPVVECSCWVFITIRAAMPYRILPRRVLYGGFLPLVVPLSNLPDHPD